MNEEQMSPVQAGNQRLRDEAWAEFRNKYQSDIQRIALNGPQPTDTRLVQKVFSAVLAELFMRSAGDVT